MPIYLVFISIFSMNYILFLFLFVGTDTSLPSVIEPKFFLTPPPNGGSGFSIGDNDSECALRR